MACSGEKKRPEDGTELMEVSEVTQLASTRADYFFWTSTTFILPSPELKGNECNVRAAGQDEDALEVRVLHTR